MIIRGWNIHEASRWTRKAQSDREQDTNIDIVASSGFDKKDITIEVGKHDKKISDHAPIMINIKDKDKIKGEYPEKDKIINKEWLN